MLQSPLWKRQLSHKQDNVETNRAYALGHKLCKPSSFCRPRTMLKVVGTELSGSWRNLIRYTSIFKTADFLLHTWLSHTAPFRPSLTMLTHTLKERESNRVTTQIIQCLLGCEPRSLVFYRRFRGICRIHTRSRTFFYFETGGNSFLRKHNCYPTIRCRIPKYKVPFTVTSVRTSPLTLLPLRQHVMTAYGGVEVKLSTTWGWTVSCGLRLLYLWGNFFRCSTDSRLATLGLLWTSYKREDYCPCRKPQLSRPAYICGIPTRATFGLLQRRERRRCVDKELTSSSYKRKWMG
jgi:hypothetical protein